MTSSVDLRFVVLGEPIAKARPRASARGSRILIYTPSETTRYEEGVRKVAEQARVRRASEVADLWPMDAASYFVSMAIFTGRRNPDADNVAKSVVDGMIGALYSNDNRVGCFFPPPCRDLNPRVEVSVRAFVHRPWLEVDRVCVEGDALVALCSRVASAKGPSRALLLRELRTLASGGVS